MIRAIKNYMRRKREEKQLLIDKENEAKAVEKMHKDKILDGARRKLRLTNCPFTKVNRQGTSIPEMGLCWPGCVHYQHGAVYEVTSRFSDDYYYLDMPRCRLWR